MVSTVKRNTTLNVLCILLIMYFIYLGRAMKEFRTENKHRAYRRLLRNVWKVEQFFSILYYKRIYNEDQMIYLRSAIPIILSNGSSPFSIFCAYQNIHIMPYRIKINSPLNGLHTIC